MENNYKNHEGELYNSIFRRSSCREYIMDLLSDEFLEEINKKVKSFATLYQDVTLSHRFTTEVKGKFSAKCPHYLIISGSGKSGEFEEVGFIYQQLILWFDGQGIGSIWLGSSKASDGSFAKNDIITIGFGKAVNSIHRELGEEKRKPISEVTNDIMNKGVIAARLAPSGINLQPWYFDIKKNKVIVYKKTPSLVTKKVYKLTDVDMGIALCHYMLACKKSGESFKFKKLTSDASQKGYLLFGEIK